MMPGYGQTPGAGAEPCSHRKGSPSGADVHPPAALLGAPPPGHLVEGVICALGFLGGPLYLDTFLPLEAILPDC